MDNSLIKRQDAIDAINAYLGLSAVSRTIQNMTSIQEILENLPSAEPEIVRCKDCKWGREVCGNIECFVDSNIPPEYHGYEWFCPNGEKVKRNDPHE